MKPIFGAFAVLAATFGLVSNVAAETVYKVQDLGALPGDFESIPYGVNANGDVVGVSTGPDGPRGFVFTDEAGLVELPPVESGTPAVGRDINDFGQIAGQSNSRAALWRFVPGREMPFGAQYIDSADRVSEAVAINNSGEIAGWSEPRRSLGKISIELLRKDRYAFYYSEMSGFIDITSKGVAEATDINGLGQVVGNHDELAFLWDGGAARDIATPGGFESIAAYGLNDLEEIVGSATHSRGALQQLLIFVPGVGVEALGGVGDTNRLRRINNSGVAVGQGRLLDGKLQGVVFSREEGLLGLNDRAVNAERWHIENATDINEDGVIVASALNLDTRVRHAVRLVPTVRDDSCVARCARSSSINFSIELTRDAARVLATVQVVDENGTPLDGVSVSAQWVRVSTSARDLTETTRTDAAGQASFATAGPRGTYTLRVTQLRKAGYTFDRDNSKLQASVDA